MKRSASHRLAPVGQLAPPTHAAARLMGVLRVVRGSLLLTTGTGLAPHLTPTGNTEITKCIQRCLSTPRHTDRDRSEWVIGIAWNS